MLKKISNSEIAVGESLVWPVFDEEGRLLLNEGNIVPSARILDAMLEHGMYRKMQVTDVDKVADNAKVRKNPFELLNECADYMEGLFVAIEDKDKTVEYRVQQLAKGMVSVIKNYPDACLGAIHLCHHGPYTRWHPLCVAVMCELVAKRVRFSEEDRFAVLATAITSNIGMHKLQETLQMQAEPLSSNQKKHLNAHPAKSAEMLMETGITNVGWIKAVFQHHERIDGSGYPEGINGIDIGRPAKLVAIADRYAAMVRGMAYREAVHGKDTLRELLIENGKYYDQELSLVLISELGVYPPGSIVLLKNGEIGVVVNRGKDKAVPLVSTFIDMNGDVKDTPILRNCLVTDYQIKDKFNLQGELPFSYLDIWNARYATNDEISAA